MPESYARYGCVNDAAFPTCVQTGFTLTWQHEGYQMSGSGTTEFTLRNDVALLKLNSGYGANQFPSSVGTICLPGQRFPYSEEITVLGWGGMNSNGDQSSVLKEVWLFV